MNMDEEAQRLQEEIKCLGKQQDDGSYRATFRVLFNDDRCANIFEALVGTLKAPGVHDNVHIVLKSNPPGEATPS